VGNRGSRVGLLVAVEEHLEDVDSVVLVSLVGVVALGLQHWLEGGVGGVVGAGFADRLELAVDLWGPVAPSVTQHSLVVLVGELGHAG